ncbi:lyase family protein, partial [Candidatus Gracilibacteria bacterium]|nr:lyase family protein [Candidatus Gracilibacteria bacterium]
MDYRIEHDSLGEKQIPVDALYGIQTLRAALNFPISEQSLLPEVVRAYALLKKSAAIVNRDLGKLDPAISKLITKVCREILEKKHNSQFIVDVFQAGAGTSTNMNLNEVIANRALELMGESKGSYDIVSPNDHVNMSQSTNDTYPTMMRVALALQSKEFLKNL